MAKKLLKRDRIYQDLGQGVDVLYDPEDAEVDILAVPGLGTNPRDCWEWKPASPESDGKAKSGASQKPAVPSEPKFNWILEKQGLADMYPKARIMLYDYASAWKGSNKVSASMRGICSLLLEHLAARRRQGTEVVRPLIFIAHSMGGVVVAKALDMARTEPRWEALVTCTMGCAFFGTPFRGTNMAKFAMLYNSVFGSEAYDALISFMQKERNDMLNEVTDNFIELSSRLSPPIQIYCFYEQIATAVNTYSDKILPTLLQNKIFVAGARKIMDVGLAAVGIGSSTLFVEPEDARLPGAHNYELTLDHRSLVKFSRREVIEGDPNMPRGHGNKFLVIRESLNRLVESAQANSRRRTAFLGQKLLTQKFVNQVRQSLDSTDMRAKYRMLKKERPTKSWLTTERLYQQWLSKASPSHSQNRFLWFKGGPGLGKTTACLAAIKEMTDIQLNDQRLDGGPAHGETFFAYFLCDPTTGCCTAEDVLRSLITQVIDQDESLAQHARIFLPNSRYSGLPGDHSQYGSTQTSGTGGKATATVQHLWKCLQDMIEDPIVNSIHLVISNLHCLDTSQSAHSTTDFLKRLSDNAASPEIQRSKWLLTSRNDPDISRHLNQKEIAVIDLENDREHGGKIRNDRQQRAREAVIDLSSAKEYPLDIAYYVRNTVASKSEDEKWIEVVCLRLRALPANSSYLSVKQVLKEVGHHKIQKLIDDAWNKILNQNVSYQLELEELMQALTIAFEPPTIADLAIITGIEDSDEVAELVRMCYPILRIGDQGEKKHKVVFTHAEFRDRLTGIFHGTETGDNPDKKRYHGLVALRCFRKIALSYNPAKGNGAVDGDLASHPTANNAPQSGDNTTTLEIVTEEDEMVDVEAVAAATSTKDCHYPTKHLFSHLSEATSDATQDLFKEDSDFWGLRSDLRTAWLKDFQVLASIPKELETAGMTAVHIAAAIGAVEIVSTLLNRIGTAALSWQSDDGKTPLHIAAFCNQRKTVNFLLRQEADIEAGEGETGTPLHFAALQGHSSVMEELINRGANVNAFSQNIGPVINAAIQSGEVTAVQQIMKGDDIHFDFDYTTLETPLSLSARLSEADLFEKILITGRDKWIQNAKLLDRALESASPGGVLEKVRILLDFDHQYTRTTIENSILYAALEKKWDCVNALLDHAIKYSDRYPRGDISLGNVFYLASTSKDNHPETLNKIWSISKGYIPRDIMDFALYQAAGMEKNDTVAWLLGVCKANPNATAEQPRSLRLEQADIALILDYCNPLNAAANVGNVQLVKYLVEAGADLDGEKSYALHLAAKKGHNTVVQYLLEKGADINRVVPQTNEISFTHATALQAACDNNHVAVVETLIQNNADPNLGGGAWSNPITAATQKADPAILKILLSVDNIDVNVTGGQEKSTPLINAAANMATDFVKMLVKKGADINARNSLGDTPLVMASSRGEKDSIKFLCENKADVTYRHPSRGLPISIAAEGKDPSCAHLLADRMGGTIEKYREQAEHIHPRELEAARATIKLKEGEIETLRSRIVEKEDLLEEAQKENDIFQLQQKRFMSDNSFQGATYASVGQQMLNVRGERDELQRQLDAARGQIQLANDTVNTIQKVLKEEREKSAQLRKRYGFETLQQEKEQAVVEKDAAFAQMEELKRVFRQQEEEDQYRKTQLEDEIQRLLKDVNVMQEELNMAHLAIQQGSKDAKQAAQLTELARAETKEWQAKHADVQNLLISVRQETADAEKRREEQAAEQAKVAVEQQQKATEQKEKAPVQRNGSYGFGEGVAGPSIERKTVGSPRLGSPTLGSPPMGSLSPSMEQPTTPNGTSPRANGFRSLHGVHRADGSFGGYKNRKVAKKQDHDSNYSNSDRGSIIAEKEGE